MVASLFFSFHSNPLRMALLSLLLIHAVSGIALAVPAHPRLECLKDYQEEIDRRVQLGYNRHIVLAILDSKDEQFLYSGNWGMLPEGISPDLALFEIASVTKSLTAHLLMILQEEGILSLDQPVCSYLPQSVRVPSIRRREITLRHLLTHTSGLTDPVPEEGEHLPQGKILVTSYRVEDMYHYLNQTCLKSQPGSCIEYSNLGYGLAAHIAERVTGKSYATLLQEKILGPLGMKHTFVGMPEGLELLCVEGTENGMRAPRWEIQELKGFGSLLSCARDLSTYLRYLFFDTQCPKSIKSLLLSPFKKCTGMDLWFAYGWGIEVRYGGRLYVTSGISPGFTVFAGWNAHTQKAVVLLTDSSSLDLLGHHLLNPKFPLTPLYPTVQVDPMGLKRYEGTYRARVKDTIVLCRVIASDGYLEITAAGELPVCIYPMGGHRFTSKYFGSTHGVIEFAFNKADKKELTIALSDELWVFESD